MNAIYSVSRYELERLFSKRSLYLVIILMILPLITSLILRKYQTHPISDPNLWATMMGFRLSSMEGTVVAAASLNLMSWWWLITILYSGDLFASDLQDGSIRLILSRPVTRGDYIAGKMLSLTLLLVFLSLVGGLSIYLAAWLLGGFQKGFHLMILASIITVASSFPLLLASALLGFRSKSTNTGFIGGFVVYFVSQIVISILALVASRLGGYFDVSKLMDLTILYKSILPFDPGTVPMLLYNYIVEGSRATFAGTIVNVAKDLQFNILGLAVWSGILGSLMFYGIKRQDL